MKKKILVLLFGFLIIMLLGVISSCICGGPGKIYNVKVASLNWSVNKTDITETVVDGYIQKIIDFQAIVNDSIDYNKLSINFTPNLIMYSHQSNIFRFNLLPSANACSPPSPDHDFLDSIKIESNKQFDSSHPVGSNLADLFDIASYYDNYNNYNKTRYNTIGEISNLFNFNKASSYFKIFDKNYVLLLKKMPMFPSDYQFTVKIYRRGVDSDYFEYTTPKIFIKN